MLESAIIIRGCIGIICFCATACGISIAVVDRSLYGIWQGAIFGVKAAGAMMLIVGWGLFMVHLVSWVLTGHFTANLFSDAGSCL